MAVPMTHITPSVANAGTGPPINTAYLKTYEALDSPAYSGGSSVGQGDPRNALQFVYTDGAVESANTLEWVFASTSARDAEIVLIDAIVAQIVA